MNQFVWGVLTASGGMAVVFFWRFWKVTRDRVFLFFASAALALSVSWVALAVARPESEGHWRLYVVRLLAFTIVLAGVLDKSHRLRQ